MTHGSWRLTGFNPYCSSLPLCLKLFALCMLREPGYSGRPDDSTRPTVRQRTASASQRQRVSPGPCLLVVQRPAGHNGIHSRLHTRRGAVASACVCEQVVCRGEGRGARGEGRGARRRRTFVHVAEADESICSSHKHREAIRSDCPRLSPTEAWQISLKRGIGPASSLICSRHVATISFATSSTSSLLYVHANLLRHAREEPGQPRRHARARASARVGRSERWAAARWAHPLPSRSFV